MNDATEMFTSENLHWFGQVPCNKAKMYFDWDNAIIVCVKMKIETVACNKVKHLRHILENRRKCNKAMRIKYETTWSKFSQ